MQQFLGLVPIATFLVAAPPYILDTIRGKTRPERATWFIWSVLGIIAFISQAQLGAQWSLVFAGSDALGSILIFVLSVKFGVGGWTKLDRVALLVAGAGLAVSLIEQQPLIALLGVVLADMSGTALTVLKTFNAPDSETTISWLVVAVGAFSSILSVGRFDFGLILFPAYLVVANCGVIVAQLLGRIARRRRPHTV